MFRDLLKRSQFRSALAFTALFGASVLFLFSVLILSTTSELEDGIVHRVERARDALLGIDRRFGFEELINVVTDEAESVGDADSIFSVIGNDGRVHAGNVTNVKQEDGWQLVNRQQRQPGASDTGRNNNRYYAIWADVSQGRLLVGRSDREARQSKSIMMQSLGWGLLGTAILSVGTAIILSQGTQKRINRIRGTLSAVAVGDLNARVPTGPAGDDLDEVASSINAMLAKLQRLVENVNQSSADIAHDLKRPMMHLRQRLELMRDEVSTNSTQFESFEAALESVDSIVGTFEALLNIGQLQAGERRQRFIPVDISQVVRDVHEAYEPVFQDQGFAFQLAPLPEHAIVAGDRELLVQMLANVFDNALRHCPAGTAVVVTPSCGRSTFHIAIADNGPGIPAPERSKVFERFYRLERARSTPGHGLGLSVVAAIVELHEGEIALDDAAPGTVISVRLPLLN